MSGKSVAKRESFAVDMPENAPALGFDVNDPAFSWRQVMPSNFWNMDMLQERHDQLGGWPVLTPARVVIKPVYDPADYDGKEPPPSELTPKIVLEFEERAPALVFNKTRCELATAITGTPNPARWAERLGPIMLAVGVKNSKAQILFERATKPAGNGDDLDDLNEELFG